MEWRHWIIFLEPGSWAGRDLNNMPQLVLLDLKLPKIWGLGSAEKGSG